MQLPHELQHFPEPTLILVADDEHALLWLAGGDSMEPLDGIALPPEDKSDSEGSFASSDGSRVAGPDSDPHDTPRKKKFTKMIADEIGGLVQQGKVTKIRLAARPEILHLIEEQLSPESTACILSKTEKDLMKLKEVDVVTRMVHGE